MDIKQQSNKLSSDFVSLAGPPSTVLSEPGTRSVSQILIKHSLVLASIFPDLLNMKLITLNICSEWVTGPVLNPQTDDKVALTPTTPPGRAGRG